MDSYVTGVMIKKLREKKKLTQLDLAQILNVSEKTISKWETSRGLPDISLLEPLSKALSVSLIELFNGEKIINNNKSSNDLKTKFYVCPICGNVVTSLGEGIYSCCGNRMLIQEALEADKMTIEEIDGQIHVTVASPMTKEDYISFIAYVTSDKIYLCKLYPEGVNYCSFLKSGHGYIYYYDIKNGLFNKRY